MVDSRHKGEESAVLRGNARKLLLQVGVPFLKSPRRQLSPPSVAPPGKVPGKHLQGRNAIHYRKENDTPVTTV